MKHRTKPCRTCGVEKSIRCFYRHAHMRDGHMSSCKTCHCEYTAEMYRLKRERYRELARIRSAKPEAVAKRKAYAKTPRGREVHREACRVYNAFRRLQAQP